MTKTKWTPGPWATGKRTKNGYRKIDTFGLRSDPHYGLAKVVIELDGEPYKEGDANASLIAAAPDLYEALNRLLANYRADGSEASTRDIEIARSALAKARGET